MKTVYRVQLAPNLAFHVPEYTKLMDRMREFLVISEVPLCNNPAHLAPSPTGGGSHTSSIHACPVDRALEFPTDTSECYVESEDR